MVVRKYFFAGILLSVIVISLIGVASAVNNVITYDQRISLKVAEGRYMSVNSAGGPPAGINFNRETVGSGDSWEKFYLRGSDGGVKSGEVLDGEVITFQAVRPDHAVILEACRKIVGSANDWVFAGAYGGGGCWLGTLRYTLTVNIIKESGSEGEQIRCGDEVSFVSGAYYIEAVTSKDYYPLAADGTPGGSNLNTFTIYNEDGRCTEETGPEPPPIIPICNNNGSCDPGENSRNCRADCPVPKISCDNDTQIIMRLSDENNAHGALWDNTNYSVSICYGKLFTDSYVPQAGEDPHVCKPGSNNTLLYLSEGINSHASTTTSAKYTIPVCYGNLNCRSTNESCMADNETAVVTLYSLTNSQISMGNTQAIKVCCKSEGTTPSEGICGDGRIDRGEQCDGATLPTKGTGEGKTNIGCGDIDSCMGGTIICTSDCKLNTSACTGCNGTATEFCGDGIINNWYEQCDWVGGINKGPEVGDFSCASFGLGIGNLGCFNSSSPYNCTFDTSTCTQCAKGTTLCTDMICRANCTGIGFNCNENKVCEIGEGCECGDCHGMHDSCEENLTCNFKTNTCQECPAGTKFDNTINVNPILQSCSYDTNLSIVITKPAKGTGSSSWPKFTVNQAIEFNQIAISAYKDVSVTWDFGDGNITTLEDCLTTNNCNINHTYANRGHYRISAIANEQGGNRASASDSVDIMIYGPGINPFAVISNPKPGENTSDRIFFNASASFISNCSVSTSACASGCDGIGNLCCCNLPLPGRNGEPGYKFWFSWILFETGLGQNYTLLGTWNNNYSQVVEFNWSFITPGSHTATLKVGYEA